MSTNTLRRLSPLQRIFNVPLGVILALAQSLTAATFSWITAGDGNWGTAANWQGGTLPGSIAADTTLFNATGVNANEFIYLGAAGLLVGRALAWFLQGKHFGLDKGRCFLDGRA